MAAACAAALPCNQQQQQADNNGGSSNLLPRAQAHRWCSFSFSLKSAQYQAMPAMGATQNSTASRSCAAAEGNSGAVRRQQYC